MRGAVVSELLPSRALALAALLLSLGLMVGMLVLVLVASVQGLWPRDLLQFQLGSGRVILGERWAEEPDPANPGYHRLRLKVGNRDLFGQDFTYLRLAEVVRQERPPLAVALERREYGNFYGYLRALHDEGSAFTGETPGFAALVTQRLRWAKQAKERLEALAHGAVRKPLGEREEKETAELAMRLSACWLTVASAEGTTKEIPCEQVVRLWWPNQLTLWGKLGEFGYRVWQFITTEPREANTEGGIFPALFGTALMVLLMTLFVVPLGVLTAIYLREYARDSTFTRLVRMAVSTLAGVPSIVFGAFGLAFFVYEVGTRVDQLFFASRLPTPTFGTGGLLWAALTMALLTVPVVVVATEEGLSAAPQEVRDGARALGATRWETLRWVVLPYAKPGILTGVILAVARAAGEVAPLMLTGVVKLAPALPVDGTPPFLHPERKFMHLGFHIYDVGFQSPNVEAARPIVYATTLVLLLLVLGLNWVALRWRNRARRALKSAVL